jgi:hypothetical protein
MKLELKKSENLSQFRLLFKISGILVIIML